MKTLRSRAKSQGPESAASANISLLVPTSVAGMRVDVFLTERIEGLTRSKIQLLVREGSVTVDNKVVDRPSVKLKAGQNVRLEIIADSRKPIRPLSMSLNIPFEDNHLLIVDKPAGLTVHPGAGHKHDTLINALIELRPVIATVGPHDRPGIVHRLDKDTSGLLLVAKTREAHLVLSELVRSHAIRRSYLALVSGMLEPSEGIIEAPIGRHPTVKVRQAVIDGGKPARTRYLVKQYLKGATLLDVFLDTGRMHQIRVHMASIGHPVIGDQTYGRRAEKHVDLKRQFLHATRLEFDNPLSGKLLKVDSSLPNDLVATLNSYPS